MSCKPLTWTVDANGCWLLNRGSLNHGYRVVSVDGRRVRAHRYFYEQRVGPIPEGLVIDHLCRVRECANPDHMEAVTNKENLLRGEGVGALASRKTHCTRGHPLSGENLRIEWDGSRGCRECGRIRSRETYWRRKSEKALASQEQGG